MQSLDTSLKSLGAPLAVGATAEVYAWEAGWILKLFHAGQSLGAVETEARAAGAVYKAIAGTEIFSVPAAGPVVELSGRYGLLYQRIEGRSLLDVLMAALLKTPSDVGYAHRLAEIHAAIHAFSSETSPGLMELPLQSERLRRDIQAAQGLSSSARSAAQQALTNLQHSKTQLCHGDLHPSNILLTADDEAVIIDWNDATCGDPLADIARTSLLLLIGTAPPGVDTALRQVFHDAYLERYFDLRPVEEGRIRWNRWLVVIAAARLSEDLPATEQAPLLEYITANLP